MTNMASRWLHWTLRLRPGTFTGWFSHGLQAELQGELYDLQNPETPVAALTLHDDLFSSGYSGLFIYDNSANGKQAIDFTADNFSAGPAQPQLQLDFDRRPSRRR